ncbi:Double-strand break repair protein [Phytophthora fragariae]|uniref:Double-strand break repair protein n=1 Tax=Phytophthora fragariae TaxID=53985 RepID=A0A6A3JGN9_9STRA|nr:Double-strand break repair protein [Phytophthora fragariae]KAE9088073.1 Double-strand break repair protein [Phytophthora fragariae]KAE9200662.1 Double-strand break repair protein [Phytophthora fragariae]
MSQSQEAAAAGPREADTLRVLLSTDNHLGYAEKDPVRGNDSFRSFREILQLAQRERVDLLLLGGDLFHENKPSRRTLYETMRLLRTHCMGDGAVHFQVVSDQSLNFPNFGAVNFEDPNYNVELPVFSIHGNHDDPSREGGGNYAQSLAALDLLSAANLVNYFGKSDKVDEVEVFPVLLTKGDTRVAVYGLGNMRDERLNRMFAQQKVVFRRPAEHADQWFSIFVVHQNRDDKGRGSKNCVPESVIPDFIDLVVWGHEHECQIDVQESLKGDFFITQPGSSVATSLVEGEAKAKHIAVLEINGQRFRMDTRELHTVRPFKMGEVILGEIEELEPNDPDVAERIREYLEGRVMELLQEAELEQEEKRRKRAKDREQRQQESPFPLPDFGNGAEEEKDLVLIRLRVEHSGFPVLVNQRFGAKFVGKVANPNDILLFYRRKKDRINASDKKATMELEKSLLSRPVRPTPLAAVTIEDILSKQLCMPERKLVLLPEAQLGIALEKFTLKNNTSAIQEFVDSVLDETQRELSSKSDARSAQDILTVVGKKKEQTDALLELQKEEEDEQSASGQAETPTVDRFQSRRTTQDDDGSTKSQNGRFGTPRTSQAKKTTPKKKPVRKSVFSDLEGESDESPQKRKPTARKTTPRKAPARSERGKARKTALSDDEFEDEVSATAEDDGDEDFKMDEDEDEEEDMTPRPSAKPRGRATARSSTKAKKSPPNRKRLRKSNDDDEEEDDDFAPAPSKRSATAAAKRSTARESQASDVFDLCSDSEPEKPAPKKRAKQTKAKIPQQHKIDHLFKKQQPKRDEDDDVESDHEFTQLARKADARAQDIVGRSQTQSESQAGGGTTRRKLPLSMVAASQSQSQQEPKQAGTAAPAVRKGWGRSRR